MTTAMATSGAASSPALAERRVAIVTEALFTARVWIVNATAKAERGHDSDQRATGFVPRENGVALWLRGNSRRLRSSVPG